MCTVTYLPTASGYILTHNRDEAPTRNTPVIDQEELGGRMCYFPRDTGAGGAWIATTPKGPTVCLLNGAFEQHERRPPYKKSRGLILLEFMEQPDWKNFVSAYDLKDIEPFTFLYFAPPSVFELRWDGTQKHLHTHNPEDPGFWCSATLYPKAMQEEREKVFRNWLANRETPVGPEDALKLHREGSVGDPENDFVMNRSNIVRTVSITQVIDGENARMDYFDLLDNRGDTKLFSDLP